jgi:murein tripeptide amidase MpaA
VLKWPKWTSAFASILFFSCWNGTEPSPPPDVRLVTDFEGASLGWHAQVGPREFYISIRHDTNSGYLRWYSFRVEGGSGEELTFRITNANETSSDSAWEWDQPVVSADAGETWSRITDTDYEGPSGRFFTFQYTPQTNSDWIAYTPVYNYSRWLNSVEELRGHPRLDTLEVVAMSIEGNPIHLLKVSDASVSDSTKTAVWMVARQHPADAGASWIVEGLLRWLLGQDPDASRLASRCVLYLVPFMNPDGVLDGNYLTNSAGVNLNRQWPSPDSASAPSVLAVSNLMHAYFDAGGSAEIFVDIHSRAISRSNFLFFNGPDVTSPERAAEIQSFAEVLNRINPDFTAQGSEAWPGDITISSRWASDAFGIHGIVFEASFQDVEYGPFEGEYMTVDRYLALGEALGKAVLEFFYSMDDAGAAGSQTAGNRYR